MVLPFLFLKKNQYLFGLAQITEETLHLIKRCLTNKGNKKKAVIKSELRGKN
jgi:hypothetical protein